jgi:geranylgeranyl diphosphate synthase, type II
MLPFNDWVVETASPVSEYFSRRRQLIHDRLTAIAAEAVSPAPLRAALQAAICSSGKRVRGSLLIAVGEAHGARAEGLVDAACAFEMIHSSSLIVDDLPALDDAELRRGAPTLHRAYGEDLAILSALALLNYSYRLVTLSHAALRPGRWSLAQLIDRVVHSVGWDGSIGGEAVDLHSDDGTLDFATLEYIHSRKTGALFVAAAAVGAMLGNASAGSLAAMEAYAKNLGLAFQITDDILDVTSTPESLGKDVGKDEQRLTFVKLAGVDGARRLSEELIATSIAAIAPLGASGQHLRELAVMVRDRTS